MKNVKKKLELINQEGVTSILCDLLQLYTQQITGVEIPFKDARHWITLLGNNYRSKLPKTKIVKQLDSEEAIKRESKTFQGWKRKKSQENGKAR